MIWTKLQENPNIKLSFTNKVHILVGHILEYISKTGFGLGMASDQNFEETHQELAKRMEKSMYNIKDKDCSSQSKKLFGVNDDNSFKLNLDCLKC